MTPRALTFNELRERVLAAAAKAGLEVYAETTLLDLGLMERTLKFCVVPKGWQPPFHRHAEIRVLYDVKHQVLAEHSADELAEPRPEFDEIETDTEIEIAYALVGPGSGFPLLELNAHVDPLAAKINRTLGGQRRQTYFTVSTGHPETGEPLVVEAKVLDLVITSVLEGKFDVGFLKRVAAALRAVGPA